MVESAEVLPVELRSALYLDFDNVYIGLRNTDPHVASAFASNPASWVEWLEAGQDASAAVTRRFLVKACYLNPSGGFGRYRAQFLAAGFSVIDCPSLTSAGKNSADIHIVMDVLDALSHTTRYDEFVLGSADADFTPVARRVRAYDRRVTVLTAGNASAAYQSVADHVVEPEQLAVATRYRRPNALVVPQPPAQPPVEVGGADGRAESAAAAVAEKVASSLQPVPGSTAAHVALAVDPDLKNRNWEGTGSFGGFVQRYLPRLSWVVDGTASHLADPRRHRVEAAETDDEDVVVLVARATRAPRLSSEQFVVLFQELVDEVEKNGFSVATTPVEVRERCTARGIPVSRSAATFVVKGVALTPRRLGQNVVARPIELARAYRDSVVQSCRAVQMDLDEGDLAAIDTWILGGFPAA